MRAVLLATLPLLASCAASPTAPAPLVAPTSFVQQSPAPEPAPPRPDVTTPPPPAPTPSPTPPSPEPAPQPSPTPLPPGVPVPLPPPPAPVPIPAPTPFPVPGPNPPPANASVDVTLTATPSTADTCTAVVLSATAIPHNGAPAVTAYLWDFNSDGQIEDEITGATIRPVFGTSGPYRVTVTARAGIVTGSASTDVLIVPCVR